MRMRDHCRNLIIERKVDVVAGPGVKNPMNIVMVSVWASMPTMEVEVCTRAHADGGRVVRGGHRQLRSEEGQMVVYSQVEDISRLNYNVLWGCPGTVTKGDRFIAVLSSIGPKH